MHRGSIFQLVFIGLVAGAISTAVAIFVPWLPTSASKEADRITFVYWFTIVICLVIFAVVSAILIYAMINFRVKDGDLSDGPPVHGHTGIEIIWTITPAILVTAIAVVSAIVLAKDSHAGKNPLVVKVYAQQFDWRFQYPNGQFYPILRLPLDRGVKLQITSEDVIHSFWVPQFAQKQDAVPGQWNDLVITPNRLNTPKQPFYPLICTELCGLGHSLMRSEAIVMTPAAWSAWYHKSSAPPPPTGGTIDPVAVFTKNGCVACHVFKPIPAATGTIGPSLDKLKEAAAAAGQPLDAYIKQSIVDPNAVIAKGYASPSSMPPGFDKSIPADQLDALVQYLAQNTN